MHSLIYTGLDLRGQLVYPGTLLPGLCLYLGSSMCADALAADYRWADSQHSLGIEITVDLRLWTPHPGSHAWDWWADGAGELIDLRGRRCGRQVTAQVADALGTRQPRALLAAHPERIQEVATLVFPNAQVIVWRVDTRDQLRRPLAWLRTPKRVVRVTACHPYQALKVDLPAPNWSGWSDIVSPLSA